MIAPKISRLAILAAIVLFAANQAAQAHRLHAGLSVIEYGQDPSEIQITHRLYAHDFEKIIYESFDHGWDDQAETLELIKTYCQKRFVIALDGKVMELEFVGSEAEAEYIFVYFTLQIDQAPKQLIVLNALLMDQFPEQINLTNIRLGSGTISATTSAGQTTKTLALGDG
ncbi:MAG: hypothetical protein COA47_07765 [Robiginitomaculum sp.]|nr:MAG: hypothetical protein COA47_07765 [Robiginitomaculum sp.]